MKPHRALPKALLATVAGLSLALCAALSAAAAPLGSRCPTAQLVDAPFRDAALVALGRLIVNAPGTDAHGAVRSHDSTGHVDPQGRGWQQVSAYAANLGLIGALRVSPALRPAVADWLRWQARHMVWAGPLRGVVLDHWMRQGDTLQVTCPPGMAARLCGHVDAYDSTAASLLLLAQAFAQHGGDVAVLRDAQVRQALEAAASALQEMSRPDGLTWAKPDHRVAYLMDAVEAGAGWRAWAWLQGEVFLGPAAAARRDLALKSAQRIDSSLNSQLWDAQANRWRVFAGATRPLATIWYPDTMAQAWPLLWSGGADDAQFARARQAWSGAASHWQGRQGGAHWARQNVDPDGFWWPAAAVAAHCLGDQASARTWVARARERWMQPASPFAWTFQVSDLLWLLWLAEPLPAGSSSTSLPTSLPIAAPTNPPLSQEKT